MRIGEFIVEFEKISTNLRFFYNCLLQYKGLDSWKLGSFLLNIETIGPSHLSLCLCAAIKTLFPKADQLNKEAVQINKETQDISKVRNEIAHGEWALGPEIVIVADKPELPQKMGIKRKNTKAGERVVELPTLDELSETIERTRALVKRITDLRVQFMLHAHKNKE